MGSRSSSFLSAMLLIALFPLTNVSAQEAVDEAAPEEEPRTTISEEVVVTATRTEAAVETIGSSVSLVTLEEIEDQKKTSVLELLRTVPGIEVAQTGGRGRIASVSLRGGSSAHTLVLVDGVRLNSNTGANVDFADLRSENIERIEVVRGPQSTLYGSEAMGGVLNIITRRGRQGRYGTLSAEGGSESYRSGRLTGGGGNAKVDFTGSASTEETDGISAAAESAGNTEADGYEVQGASARLGLNLDNGGRADLSLRWSDSTTDLDGFVYPIGPTDALNYVQEHTSLAASLKVNLPLRSWWNQTFTLSLADDDLGGTDPDTSYNNFDIRSTSEELTLLADFMPAENDLLSVGASFETRQGVNVGTFDEEVELTSFFFQNQWNREERLFLTVGARHDDHSQFGSETTYRGTLAVLLANGRTRLHASYGTGFRAPSLNELYFPFYGNLALKPETSRGFDAGVEQQWMDGKAVLDVTYFDNSFDDLIGYDFTIFLANNVAEASTSGVEATLRLTPGPKFNITATYTDMDSEDETTGLPLGRRPAGRGTLTLAFQPAAALRGHLTYLMVRDRVESSGAPMDDYDRVDLALSYRFAERYNLYVRAQNLFDEDYQEVPGYTTPGFTPAAGLSIDF